MQEDCDEVALNAELKAKIPTNKQQDDKDNNNVVIPLTIA
jgi:hypothetical protein